MITSSQMRAARALLGLDQRQLAEMAGLSLPTIQRMEASGGQVRGIIDTLMKVIEALEGAGIELIGDNAPSAGRGRGVRLREAGVKAAVGVGSGFNKSAPAGDAA
jgi:transcriptional regulator with XRE-family HTH domain